MNSSSAPFASENLKLAAWRLAIDVTARVAESGIQSSCSSSGSRYMRESSPRRSSLFDSSSPINLPAMIGSCWRSMRSYCRRSLGRRDKLRQDYPRRQLRHAKGTDRGFDERGTETDEKDRQFAFLAIHRPTPVLNKHCSECEFQARCRQKAIEKDDLSLLSRMTEKERKKFNSKGFFTITQLSYTFRPRRRPKRLVVKREKYHHSLESPCASRAQNPHRRTAQTDD